MIPLWLTPQVIKSSVIGVICIALFSSGYYVCSKMKAAKIERMKAEYTVLLTNNRQCLEQNARAAQSIDELEAAIMAQNEAFTKLASDSADRLAKQRLESRLALEAYRRATQQAESDYRADKEALMASMALLTATESCHQAWEEVVK